MTGLIVAALVAACGSPPAPSSNVATLLAAESKLVALGFGCQRGQAYRVFTIASCSLERPDGRLAQQVAVYGRGDGSLAGIESTIGLGTGSDPRTTTLATFDRLLDGTGDGMTRARVHDAIAGAGPTPGRVDLGSGGVLMTEIGETARVVMLSADLVPVYGHPTPPDPSPSV